MSRTKHLSKTILAILFWVIVFVISAEILLRISCNYCTWSEANGGDFVSPYAIDESSYYLVREKNWSGRYTQPEFDYEIRTNSLGFRDIEHPIAKTHGEYRILAIGDSFTEGQGAPFEQTPMRVLIHNLNHNKKHQHFTMLNAGVAGSDPFYGFRIMVDKLLAYQPDLVMMIINDSDVKDVIRRGGKERFLQNGRVQGVAPPSDFLAWLYRNSHFARFILFETIDYTHLLITESERERRAIESREKIQRLILELDAFLENQGVEFVVIVLPSRRDIKRNHYHDLTNLQALLDFARVRGIRTIDVKPYLMDKLTNGNDVIEDIFWSKDQHFKPLGYRYMAEAIQQGLCDPSLKLADQLCPTP